MHLVELATLKKGWWGAVSLILVGLLATRTTAVWTQTNETIIEVMSCTNNSKENRIKILPPFVNNYQPLYIRFKDKTIDCQFGSFKIVVSSGQNKPGNNKTLRGHQNLIQDKPHLTPQGDLQIGVDSYSNLNYCIDQLNSSQIIATVCNGRSSEPPPSIRKCCQRTELWDVRGKTCRKVQSSAYYDPPFYTISSNCVEMNPPGSPGNSDTERLNLIPGLPQQCLTDADRNTIPSINIPNYGLGRFRLLVNGSVLISHDSNGSWYILEPESYCIDGMTNYSLDYKKSTSEISRQSKSPQVLLVCKDEYKVKDTKRRIPFKYAIMLFSAATILLVNGVIYLLLWDKHNIYEWTVFFEVIAMLFMILFVGVSNTVARNPNSGHLTSVPCIFLGAASHFFFLATFFWLLVINFEIWWNFRILTITNKKSRRWLRLLNYQLFAWGCPTIIIVTGLLLDAKYGLQNEEIDCPNIIVPNYGQLNCYISKRAQGPYLYFPVGILLGCNLLFYTLTVFKMCEYQKNSQAMTQSRNRGHFQPVVVFARLFIVMGVSWIFEIVAWGISPLGSGTIPLYWIVFDVVTLLQAIAIFVIFICRKEIVQKLGDKYPRLKPCLAPFFKLPCCGSNQPQVQPSPRSFDNDLNTAKRSVEDITSV